MPLGHRWALCSVSMAGTWQRIKGIFQAKANKALDKAEDPRDMLDLSYEQQLQQLQKIRRSVADVATARKRIELQAQGLQKQADKLQGQAKAALQQSNEDLAHEALARRAALGEQLTDLKVQHDQIIEQEQKLVDTSQQLQSRVEQFRTRKETLKASYTAAEATTKVNEAVSGISSDSIGNSDGHAAGPGHWSSTPPRMAATSKVSNLINMGQGRPPSPRPRRQRRCGRSGIHPAHVGLLALAEPGVGVVTCPLPRPAERRLLVAAVRDGDPRSFPAGRGRRAGARPGPALPWPDNRAQPGDVVADRRLRGGRRRAGRRLRHRRGVRLAGFRVVLPTMLVAHCSRRNRCAKWCGMNCAGRGRSSPSTRSDMSEAASPTPCRCR